MSDRQEDRKSPDAKGPEGGMNLGGGINGIELQNREKDVLFGTGGSSGGGTIAGSGDTSGGATGRDQDPALPTAGDAGDAIGRGKLAAAGANTGPRGGEALGAGAGRGNTGSGTPRDTGDLGGGGT